MRPMTSSSRSISNLGIALATVVLLLAAAWGYLFSYPAAPVDPAWELAPASDIPDGAVTVNFAGTTTLLVSDGETQFLFDGWFSRPGPLTLLFGEFEPDLDNISYGLEALGVTELDAVLPVHSHYDHAMDTPEVAKRTGATVYGSEATANICRGWDLPETQIAVLSDRAPFQLGQFVITPIESKHMLYENPEMVEAIITNWEITEPLVPPAKITDYKLGKAYIFHVAHPKGSFLLVGSAGFVPGRLEGLDVDVIFLGTGGLGTKSDDYIALYWDETVGMTNPERVIPVHYDSLTGPLQGPMTGEVRISALIAPGSEKTLAFLKAKDAADPEQTFATLPRFQPIVLFP